MIELINEAVKPGAKFRLRPSTIMDLDRIATEGLMTAPGSFRLAGMGIDGAGHIPPPWDKVAAYVDEMCEYVLDNWSKPAGHLAAYVLWRINWIHPFRDGNGRTARAVSYLVLCARLGYKLPGTVTIPERIAANKGVYYKSLEAADAAYANGQIDVSKVEELLSAGLAAQLHAVVITATTGNAEA